MNNKLYLKQIIEELDKEYPNSAMVFGTESMKEDSPYVFVLIDDDYMYFGKQIPDSENVKIKRVDLEKISRIFFVGEKFSVQMKGGLYEMTIFTQEAALRSLCKEFKTIKTKEITVKTGDIMDLDLVERIVPEQVYNHLRTDISPFGVQKSNTSQSGEYKGLAQAVKNNEIHDVVEQTRLFTHDEINPKTEPVALAPDAFETLEQMLKRAAQSEPVSELPGYSEHAADDLSTSEDGLEAKKDILIPTGEHPVIKTEKQLTKKEKKALDKKRKQEEKEEREYYKSGHPVLVTIAILFLLVLGYLSVAYALESTGSAHLPFGSLLGDGIDAAVKLLNQASN